MRNEINDSITGWKVKSNNLSGSYVHKLEDIVFLFQKGY